MTDAPKTIEQMEDEQVIADRELLDRYRQCIEERNAYRAKLARAESLISEMEKALKFYAEDCDKDETGAKLGMGWYAHDALERLKECRGEVKTIEQMEDSPKLKSALKLLDRVHRENSFLRLELKDAQDKLARAEAVISEALKHLEFYEATEKRCREADGPDAQIAFAKLAEVRAAISALKEYRGSIDG